jgi:hypothetical protein
VCIIVMATLALMGSIGALMRWFYKRAGDERSLVDAVHANTTATLKLTESVSGLQGALNEHESRIRILEEREYRVHEYRVKAVEGGH